MADLLMQSTASLYLPKVIGEAGRRAEYRFIEFFTAQIRNPNTRRAYMQAVTQFLSWAEDKSLTLECINSVAVAAYIEGHTGSPLTVKQHLAAIRMFFDWMVTGGTLPQNPATAVKGPRHSMTKGKTPVLQAEDARALIESIDTTTLIGLRDRALIGVMIYSFARIGAVLGMNVGDYYPNGKRYFFRLREKGGKHHEVPCHHLAERYLDDYISEAGIEDDRKGPLFRSILGKKDKISTRRLLQRSALKAIKKRAQAVNLSPEICNHTFRATGITAYLSNGGTLENAQRIAAHASSSTTKLYDRTSDELSLSEIERIVI
jgi:site-specific recombinase XerD